MDEAAGIHDLKPGMKLQRTISVEEHPHPDDVTVQTAASER